MSLLYKIKMPLSLYSYQKNLPPKSYINFSLYENHQFEEQKGQSPEYVFLLIKIYKSGMTSESVLQKFFAKKF